jgi:hypothetical protein
MSDDLVEVMQDPGELERMLGDPTAVRRGEMGAGAVAIVARPRPHRKLGDVGIGLGVVDQACASASVNTSEAMSLTPSSA